MYNLALLLLVFIANNTSSAEICPPPEDIAPCVCSSTLGTSHANCRGINSLHQLQKSMKGFHGKHLQTFTLENSSIQYMPHDLFDHIAIQHISILKTNLSYIGYLGQPQFKGLETSLKTLSIAETFTLEHPFAYVSMSHLDSLVKLDLLKNHIEVLHNEWFRVGLKNLQELRMVKGKIRMIGYKALDQLVNLKIVDLSDNDINYVPRSVFPEVARSLQDLNLERNKLETLPGDFFTGMPNLRAVNLELNLFSTIDEKLWKPVWSHLKYLNIDYNNLVCDSKIKWMYGQENLEDKLVAMCYKPFKLMERELHTLTANELM